MRCRADRHQEGKRVVSVDLAIIAITVVSLAHVAADYRVRMRTADRTRLVSPPKAPDKDAA